nr:hypothetical protein [Halomicroarcula sp. XH51]
MTASGPSVSTGRCRAGRATRCSRVCVAREALERPVVRSFLQYYLGAAETDLVSDVGDVPLNAEAAAANRRRLERVLASQ